jgi:hypothetical protein
LLARYVTCVLERQVQQLDHVRVGQSVVLMPLFAAPRHETLAGEQL